MATHNSRAETGTHHSKYGLTLIEVLIVVAVLGILASLILASISRSRDKAYDAAIKNGIGQIRWQAELVYDSQGASFKDWTQHDLIQDELTILLADIDENYGDATTAPYVTVMRDSQEQDYCISAPQRSVEGKYFCIDREGILRTTDSHCPDYDEDEQPLECPGT